MPRTLYSPRLSDDVVRALYQEAKRRRVPMTRLADDLIAAALAAGASASSSSSAPVITGCQPTTGGATGAAPATRPTPGHEAA